MILRRPSSLWLLLALAGPFPVRAEEPAARAAPADDASQAIDAFKKSFRGTDDERAAAVRQLAAIHDRRAVDLLARAASDPAPVVRTAALQALAGYPKNAAAAQAAVGTIRAAKKEPDIRAAGLDALGRIRDWGTSSTVMEYVKDPEPAVALAAVRAAGELRNPALVGGLIETLKDLTGPVLGTGKPEEWKAQRQALRQALQASLRKITGTEAGSVKGPERRPSSWEAWWKSNAASVTADREKADREEREQIEKAEKPAAEK